MNREILKRQITKQSLEYIRAVVRVLLDEMKDGKEFSESLRDEIDELYASAYHIAHFSELKELFNFGDLT